MEKPTDNTCEDSQIAASELRKQFDEIGKTKEVIIREITETHKRVYEKLEHNGDGFSKFELCNVGGYRIATASRKLLAFISSNNFYFALTQKGFFRLRGFAGKDIVSIENNRCTSFYSEQNETKNNDGLSLEDLVLFKKQAELTEIILDEMISIKKKRD